ncbi:uncharacterized protein LACBIDRAFT_336352 [Laccaria bicolor S238N-H82]|uniref:Predicted protein n=1 Tax=Laccaria bicolor (strain S238N-H82 / ATCC MYA-4686) TaxID=486041 RepID=B0E577_LACBS|nr:uncharacterized protein LACBIDRAFT_336352 [Laccaria bicolor S238N-H82]EDQ98004.1 predicted protein [Laccaria bicolor S238N-H82]|eukprot:XP_001891346.1 predicted protein [Laccaria bicolor S238N-H82]
MTDPTLPHDHTADHCQCLYLLRVLQPLGLRQGIFTFVNFKCNGCGYHYIFPKWYQRIVRRSPALSAGTSSRQQIARPSSRTRLRVLREPLGHARGRGKWSATIYLLYNVWFAADLYYLANDHVTRIAAQICRTVIAALSYSEMSSAPLR